MSQRTVHPMAVHTWSRLTLAAFVFSVYAAIALAAGVAHADEGTAGSGGASESAAGAPSQGSGSDGPGADAGSTTKPGATTPAVPAVDTLPRKNSKRHLTIVDSTDTSDATPVDDARGSKRSTRPATPTATSKSKSTALTSAASTTTPTVRIATPTVDSAPATASLAAVTPPASTPTVAPGLDRQLVGLVADVGTVTVSAVHTVASAVAQAFGPGSSLGVPYLLATSVANAAAAVGGSLVGAGQFAPVAGRFTVTYGILDGLAFFNPTKPPAGANDPSITVSREHPLPIILLNGTTATQGTNWSVGAPLLANAGYKVYTFNYGNTTTDPNYPIQAVADIRQSGLELAAEVDRVLKETKAPKVILIGHSQGGGILPAYYINNLGGAERVSQLIGIAPSNHGTDLDGLTALQSLPFYGPLFVGIADAIGPALYQQALGSPFQQEVYGMGDTRSGVLYTTITSVNDEVVTPYTQQALRGPNVTNVTVQERYPGVVLGHANIITSPQAFALVLDALAANRAANPLPVHNTVAA